MRSGSATAKKVKAAALGEFLSVHLQGETLSLSADMCVCGKYTFIYLFFLFQ
jgi:hypothetical protein